MAEVPAGLPGTATGAPDGNAAEAKAATQGGRRNRKRGHKKRGNKTDEAQAGPSGQSSVGASTPAVLEVGTGAAPSSLAITPDARASGGAASSASAGAGEKSVLGLQDKMKRLRAAQPKGLEYVDVPQQYMEDLLAEDTACGMAELAKQARRENDPGTAQMYEEQANVHWLRHHAHVMLYPAHMRPALMPFPFPNQRPGPPLAYQADPNLPAWGSPAARSAAPGPAQATAPQGQDPAQPQGQDPAQPQGQHPEEPQGQALVLQSLMQPQPVQVQAQAQPQALHMDTAPVAQAVQPEAQTVPAILSRLDSIVAQWMPLVIQMSMDITGVQSAMAAKNEVRQKMHPVLLSMESNKDGMHSCLRLLLELAADMAPSDEKADVV